MGIKASSLNGKKPEVKKENPPPQTQEIQTAPLLATIRKSVSLRFSNGYEFCIGYENGKLIISATLNGNEAFYLDEIPEEFVESLRRML